MARTTISDTLKYVDNKYELNLLAAQRVRDLNAGIQSVLPESDDKNTVRSLREIASGKLNIPALKKELIQSYKSPAAQEFVEEQEIELNPEEAKMLEQFDSELSGGSVEAEEAVAESEGDEVAASVEETETESDQTQPVAE